MGSGSQKMYCQLNSSRASPPTGGPIATASTRPIEYMPMAKPRRSCGNTWKTVTMTSGWTIPVAAPCITRPATSMPKLSASPAMTLPTENNTSVRVNP